MQVLVTLHANFHVHVNSDQLLVEMVIHDSHI